METNIPTQQPVPNLFFRRWLEIGFILIVFFLFGSQTVPGINEPQYLGKAKHFWDTSWCPNDHFLNSSDGHFVFYYAFGWLTKWMTLEAVAWVGRIIGWLGLAFAWQRLSWRIVPQFGASILSVTVWALLIKYCHLSGEWVIGGIEAKVFAYVFVLLGVAEIANENWKRCWIYFGIASSFHVLVGGWSVVAALIASRLVENSSRPAVLEMLPSLIAGGVLSLPGLVPTLLMSSGIPTKISLDGTWYYVFRRLQHHLVFTSFSIDVMIRFGILSLLTFALATQFKVSKRLAGISRFALASILLVIVGIVIDLCTGKTYNASQLLRFYWFRLADVAVPLLSSLTVISVLQNGLRLKRTSSKTEGVASPRRNLVFGFTALLTSVCLLALVNNSIEQKNAVSKSDRQGHIQTANRLKDWREICRWAKRNSNRDQCFLAPPNHQTFKWYAHRSEVVTWKDVPQDPKGIVEWHLRLTEIRIFLNRSFEKPIDEVAGKLEDLSKKYGFQYFIVDKRLPFPKLPIPVLHENGSYVIYAVISE